MKKYVGKSTPVEETALSKNIFVFWWDGFESAPNIVRKCLESVKKYNPDSNIIEVSKNNFEDYTDIHPEILKGFYKGDISIQTFSDILRFNLLKNNGGAWIDATILFLEKFDIFEELKDKSFATISFTSSMNFLKYKNEVCSWSGYFIASRKGGYFVTVMNDLFEEYYLLYGKFPFISLLMHYLSYVRLIKLIMMFYQKRSLSVQICFYYQNYMIKILIFTP
ncbi:capsular polysaccharide synthesis protein [Streptococcus gallolyticus]|uniref:capsular polysaccharide synthesis protein n=1 Tax=Streptococcus gallolyticus TaxID=315405 RepID=UPI003D6DDD1B